LIRVRGLKAIPRTGLGRLLRRLITAVNGAGLVPRRLFLIIFSTHRENLIGIYVEDILSAAVCDSTRRAERGVFRPEIPVFDLFIIVVATCPGDQLKAANLSPRKGIQKIRANILVFLLCMNARVLLRRSIPESLRASCKSR
jgi:hypothetical protein